VEIGIVGGSGFIGSSLANHLSSENKIRVIDIRQPQVSNKNIVFKQCDVTDVSSLIDSLKGCDAVIDAHIIQIPKIDENRELSFKVNVDGTRNVCEVCRKNDSKLILAGTWHVYGEPPFKKKTIDEEYGYHPERVSERAKFYVKNKILQELVVRSYNDIYGIQSGILRMGTVLGFGMPAKTAASIFINQALTEKPITPFKSSMYRPMLYVDVDDAVGAVRKMIDVVDKKCEIVHIGNVKPITIEELAHLVKKISKSNSEVKIVDDGKEDFKKDDKEWCGLDLTRMKRVLGIDKLIKYEDTFNGLIKKIKGNSS